MNSPSFVQVNGCRIAYDEYGAGPQTFLLLHGIPGWRGNWAQVAHRLGVQARVIVPDLAGFGQSAPALADNHAKGQAAAMLQMLDALRIDSVHVAGFDFGGPVAVMLVREAASRVRSLTLLATNVFPDTPIPAPLRIAKVPVVGDLAFRLIMGRFGQRMLWVPATSNRRAFPWGRYRQVLQFPAGVRSTREIFLNSLRNLRRLYEPVEAQLARIAVPAAVLWGTSDPFFPVEVGRRTARAIPGARYVEVDDCGHFVPEEQPEIVARELGRMLG